MMSTHQYLLAICKGFNGHCKQTFATVQTRLACHLFSEGDRGLARVSDQESAFSVGKLMCDFNDVLVGVVEFAAEHQPLFAVMR